ncbi:hypothetical protein DYB35_003807 [Aphanomyces astaci]|uniref:C5orf34-like C-terminal domain-containing protein n=1 Tax=Aphanomyces astaci TaxID=112090 RepID=A0A3R7EBD9_APHAT|nr:hypothetical protein DYB35_003807 [Aphanomyces astaci]
MFQPTCMLLLADGSTIGGFHIASDLCSSKQHTNPPIRLTACVVLEPDGHCYSYLSSQTLSTSLTVQRFTCASAPSAHIPLLRPVLAFRNKYSLDRPLYLHQHHLLASTLQWQVGHPCRPQGAISVRWRCGTFHISRMECADGLRLQSLDGMASVTYMTQSTHFFHASFLAPVEYHGSDQQHLAGRGLFTRVEQCFTRHNVPKAFAYSAQLLQHAAAAISDGRQSFAYHGGEEEPSSTNVHVHVDDSAIECTRSGFFHHRRGAQDHCYTVDAIPSHPPFHPQPNATLFYDVADICLRAKRRCDVLTEAGPADNPDTPLLLAPHRVVEEQHTPMGLFRAFGDGRVRVLFRDRAILSMDPQAKFCSLFLPSGDSITLLATAPSPQHARYRKNTLSLFLTLALVLWSFRIVVLSRQLRAMQMALQKNRVRTDYSPHAPWWNHDSNLRVDCVRATAGSKVGGSFMYVCRSYFTRHSLDLLETMSMEHLQQFLRQQDQITQVAMDTLHVPFDLKSVRYAGAGIFHMHTSCSCSLPSTGTDDTKSLSIAIESTVPSCSVQILWDLDIATAISTLSQPRGFVSASKRRMYFPRSMSAFWRKWTQSFTTDDGDQQPLQDTSVVL